MSGLRVQMSETSDGCGQQFLKEVQRVLIRVAVPLDFARTCLERSRRNASHSVPT
jgi:hypothetical protein